MGDPFVVFTLNRKKIPSKELKMSRIIEVLREQEEIVPTERKQNWRHHVRQTGVLVFSNFPPGINK